MVFLRDKRGGKNFPTVYDPTFYTRSGNLVLVVVRFLFFVGVVFCPGFRFEGHKMSKIYLSSR